MNSIDIILDNILIKGKGGKFFSFANSSGKRWIMPVRNMAVAMNLYQPGWRTGKILKAVFPYIYWLKPVQKKIGTEAFYCKLNDSLSDDIKTIFSIKDFEFSIFCGTPSVHQKIVMQISCGNRILGYCKICDNKEVIDSFDYEFALLQKLESMGINSTPQPLFNDYIGDGIKMFVQSTCKTMQSKTNHEWGELEVGFLEDIYRKSHAVIKFEESDFYKDITFLRDNIGLLDGFRSDIVLDAIDLVMNHYAGKEVDFSLYHADFTPWNCYVENGKLYAFDLEYAKMSYPSYIDCFHFMVQGLIYEKHSSVDEIIRFFDNVKDSIKSWFEKVDFSFICYLLAVTFLFSKREQGKISGDVERDTVFRIELLKILLNRLK